MSHTHHPMHRWFLSPTALLLLPLWSCTPPPTVAPVGPQKSFAGRLTEANYDTERVPGPASQGLVGDYYLRNDKVRAIIQAPGRAIGPCPWGGNLIDLDLLATPGGDQLGEVSAFMQLGRTLRFDSVNVERDGSDGGPAVLVARGSDQVNDFINIVGIASLTATLIAPEARPDIVLGLQATARYTLRPGASEIEIDYSLRNTSGAQVRTGFGTLTDTGAEVEVFHPGVGYGEFDITSLLFGRVPTVEYMALQGEGISYGVWPTGAGAARPSAPFVIAGVDVEIHDQGQAVDVLLEVGRTLAIPPGQTVSRQVTVAVRRGSVGDIETAVRVLKQQGRGAVSGQVVDAAGEPVAGARVAVWKASAPANNPVIGQVTAYVTDAEGRFAGELLPDDYRVQAEGEGWMRSETIDVTLAVGQTAAPLRLTLPIPAQIAYRVRDTQGRLIPAKVTVVGAPVLAPDRRFRDVAHAAPRYGVATTLNTRSGDASANTAFDHPLTLAPGRYRVVISRGPEWSRHEQIVTLAAGDNVLVDATLERVVDTSGYVSCDFHQHTYMSPDSPVSPEERLVSYLADGLEYLSSSEHDVLFDYRPVIDQLGAGGLIDSGIGVESTPFDYGHFIAFPLPVDPLSPNGGALDWGNGGEKSLPPGEIFARFRAQGAKVVQVNHPRTPPGSFAFQQNFDRGGLRFDFNLRTFFSDPTLLELTPAELDLPDNADLISPDFNSIEVYNGFWPRRDPSTSDGERVDVLVDTVLRDWMNFLSLGMVTTAVGDSDSHVRTNAPSGIPRTLVRVSDDTEDALGAGGVGAEVADAVSGAAARDIIVTNGPMLRLSAGPGAGPGQSHVGRVVSILPGIATFPVHLEVQSAEWAPFDTLELFANSTFQLPPPQGQVPEALVPLLCFTARAEPSARCQQAAGGARPLTLQRIVLPGGAVRLEATIDTTVDLAQLGARMRPGAVSPDVWLVARAIGTVGLFPVIPEQVDPALATVDELIDGKVLDGTGIPALGFTNAVLVDVDGGGWRAPYAP